MVKRLTPKGDAKGDDPMIDVEETPPGPQQSEPEGMNEGKSVPLIPAEDDDLPEESFNTTLTLAERRMVMIEAAVNSVMSALIHRNILSAWKASGLCPLMEHPPYTREKAEERKKVFGGPWSSAKGYTGFPPADTMRNSDT